MDVRRARVRVGTSSWTDRTLIGSGWYPNEAKTPEDRLRYYASQFDVVEVDSTYYGLPSERNAILWSERTPTEFTFNVKAFSLMTGHPTRRRGLPKDIRNELADEVPDPLYPRHLSTEQQELAWEMFRSALMPLHSAGKLGVVLFQFPEWFIPNRSSKEEILRCRERLPDYEIAVEFRQRAWFKDEHATVRTLDFLRSERIPFVCVDMPQGFSSSVPRICDATSDRLALVRFHGRNVDTWGRKGVSVTERFRYEYSERELEEWAPRVSMLADRAREAHALFNNCYRDFATRNARQFADLLNDSVG